MNRQENPLGIGYSLQISLLLLIRTPVNRFMELQNSTFELKDKNLEEVIIVLKGLIAKVER